MTDIQSFCIENRMIILEKPLEFFRLYDSLPYNNARLILFLLKRKGYDVIDDKVLDEFYNKMNKEEKNNGKKGNLC